MTLSTRLSIAWCSLALLATACGDKPKPRVSLPSAPQGPSGPGGGSLESTAPSMRTVGGVDLTGASEPVRLAALQLATNRKKGVEALTAAGRDAGPVVVKLLASSGLNELLGALELIAHEGDPTGARADAMPAVIALLGHDAPDVRAAASRLASALTDPAPFIALAAQDGAAGRASAIRLLGGWSGAAVEDALVPLLARSDELALDAALALGAAGKTASPTVTDAARAATLAAAPETRAAGFALARRLAIEVPAEAIDKALDDLAQPLAAEAVRVAPPARLVAVAKREGLPTHVRRAIAEELARAPAGAERDALVDAAAADADPEVRAALAPTLVRMDEGAGSVMDKLLVDGDATVRRSAIAASTRLPAPEAATRLRARMGATSDEDDKAFILWALGQVPHRMAIDTLIDALGDPTAGPIAGIVLQVRSGKSFTDIAGWRAWADEAYPPATPPVAPAPK